MIVYVKWPSMFIGYPCRLVHPSAPVGPRAAAIDLASGKWWGPKQRGQNVAKIPDQVKQLCARTISMVWKTFSRLIFFKPWGTFYAQLIWPLVMWNADASWVKLHSMSTKFGCANTWRVVTVLVPLGNVPVATRNLFQNSHLPKASNLYRCSYHKNGKAGSHQNLCNSPRAFFQLLLCLCRCGRQAFQQPRLLAFCEVGLGWDPAHGSLCTAIALLGLHH